MEGDAPPAHRGGLAHRYRVGAQRSTVAPAGGVASRRKAVERFEKPSPRIGGPAASPR
jgi:hypothetical protein